MKLIASTIVPDELTAKYQTVTEALLDLSEDDIGHLRLNAPLVCEPNQKIIVPLSPVVTSKNGGGIGLREEIWNNMLKMKGSGHNIDLEDYFPPNGHFGFWDVEERFYRTRYIEKSVFEKPQSSQDLVANKKLKDVISYWLAVKKGDIIPFLDFTVDLSFPDLQKPWAFEFLYPGKSAKWRLSVGYRGCTKIYDYPFRASVFRRFQTASDSQPFDNLKKFIHNLIVEYLWCSQQIALRPNESESLIQHYKLLPWSYMTDISYGINIAKAFTCSLDTQWSNRTPVLYRVVLLNVDYYDFGGHFLEHLPFQRPLQQKAQGIVGLDVDMQDPTGVIVSLSEHPFYYDHKGTSWDFIGGCSFNIGDKSFNAPFLEAGEYAQLQAMLYPSEPDEVKDFFASIILMTRQNINRFGLSSSDIKAILDRFDTLEKELDTNNNDS